MHWRRYRRGLVTIPIIVAASFTGWLLGGGGYFWPRWVLLWGGVALALRASLAFRSDPPTICDQHRPPTIREVG